MYQIKAQNGYEIQVIGKGEKGLCRIEDKNYNTVYHGTYKQCLSWLKDRGLKTIS